MQQIMTTFGQWQTVGHPFVVSAATATHCQLPTTISPSTLPC